MTWVETAHDTGEGKWEGRGDAQVLSEGTDVHNRSLLSNMCQVYCTCVCISGPFSTA